MSKTDADLDHLFKRLDLDSIPHGVIRLGVQDEEGRLSQDELDSILNTDDELSFILRDHDKNDGGRHQILVEDDELRHNVWTRYTYDLTDDTGDLCLVIEARIDLVHSERFPSEMIVTGRMLIEIHDHPKIQSLAANRVAGLDQQKADLRRFLQADNNDWGLPNRTGMLLEGPPGTGKTELVIETCQELFGGMPVTISGPEILSKWVGESERLLRKQFQEAKASQSQVLYIDEIDAIARSRSTSTQEHGAQLVAQLLVLLDGVDAKTDEAPKVIASTNLSDVLDPALLRPGRLGNQPITFSRPEPLARKAIFHHYLEQIRISNEGRLEDLLTEAVTSPARSEFLDTIAAETDGYTGADIEDVIVTAVTRLQTTADHEEAALSASTIRNLISQRDQQTAGPTMSEEVVETTDSDSVQLTGDGQAVIVDTPITDTEVKNIVSTWCNRSEVDSDSAVVRSVRAAQLLGMNETDTRDRVVAAFQEDTKGPLCLYVSGLDSIVRSATHTPLATAIIETIYEEILRWNSGNLLVYETKSGEPLIAVDHLERSE